ncbi:mitochondrial matrix Mmp37-domain-containing protein [Jimgerdemannia flammicorona]|uniref:Phosphatidate cytidylyltransferase, mitochondrial n=1 Tax=Jimgerdemannia flammicorona TaxID=994334 RepID=A0A433CY91_9FUNG|nr:mitochondrial matrix Mmp37-domain-containing protein [Jimgerdemannia flammicorona]
MLPTPPSHLFRTLRPSSTTLLRPSRPSPPHLHLARHVTTISYPDLVLPPSHYTASAAAPANNHWPVRRPPSHFFNPTNIPGSPDFGANQDLRIDEETKQRLKAVLNTFRAPVRYAIAYGSGVFQQRGYETKKPPMTDFIFGVSHPQHWHSLNLQHNRAHYSFVGALGSRAVAMLQENVGAGVYFNPYVKVNGMNIKYGVISVDKLCKDLLDWETLYVAGRMHKPVKYRLFFYSCALLYIIIALSNALNPPLSHDPLPPAHAGQDPARRRPRSPRQPGQPHECAACGPALAARRVLGGGVVPPHRGNLISRRLPRKNRREPEQGAQHRHWADGTLSAQDLNPRLRGLMVQKLPRLFYGKLRSEHERWSRSNGQEVPEEDALINQQIATSPELAQYLTRGWFGGERIAWFGLHDAIARTVLTQSAKGILTAGPVKTVRYVGDKLGKWWGARS